MAASGPSHLGLSQAFLVKYVKEPAQGPYESLFASRGRYLLYSTQMKTVAMQVRIDG